MKWGEGLLWIEIELLPSLRDSVPVFGAYPGLTSGAILCPPTGLGSDD